MAAGDLRKRQQERQLARDERRASAPSGITSADAGGSRIPNAEDRVRNERVQATAARWAAAIDNGHRPEDYGYDPVTRQKVGKPVLSPAEATKSRMEMYASQQRSRTGAPAPTSTPATKPNYLTNPDPDKNGIPDSIQAPGTRAPVSAAKPVAPAAPSARFPGGKIDGKPAWQVLQEARIRTEGEDSTPSAAERRNKDEFLAWEASRQAADKTGSTPGAPSAEPPAKKPDAVATPTPSADPSRSAMNPPGTPPGSAPTEPGKGPPAAPTASTEGTPIDRPDWDPREVRNAGMGVIAAESLGKGVGWGTGKATVKAANLAGDVSAAGIKTKGFAELGKVAANEANQISKSLETLDMAGKADRAQDLVNRADKVVENAKLRVLEGPKSGLPRVSVGKASDLAEAAKENMRNFARLASDGAEIEAKAGQRILDIVEQGSKAEKELAKAKLALKTPGARVARSVAKIAEVGAKIPGAGVLKTVGKVAGKVAVPLEVAMNVVEGARLVGSAEHRAARAKEFEQYYDKGTLRSVAESALNPVAGIYSAGHQVNKYLDSRADAKAAEKSYETAKTDFDRRQALLAESGVTKEQLRAMPQKERSALLKSIRDRVKAEG